MRELVERRPLLALAALLGALTLWRLAALAAAAPPLYFDEAQYWTWAQDPAFGYYSKPPLIAWAIAASTALFGDGEVAVKLPSLLCYPAAALAIYAAARRLFADDVEGPRVAFVAALAYATLPTVSFYSWAATTDAPLVLCWALGTWALLRVRDEGGWRDWLALGAAVGIGCLAKYAMLVFAASAGAWLLLEQRERLKGLKPLAAAALALLILAPNLLWNAQHDFPTVRHTAEISHLDSAGLELKPLLEFASSQFAVFGPVLMVALLAALSGAFGRVRLLLWLGLPMLTIILVQALLARAFANWAQACYVPLTIVAVSWLMWRGKRGWLVASFALHLAFAAVLYHSAQAYAAFGVETPRALDLTARMRAWPVAGARIGELIEARGGTALLSDEREILAELAYYGRGRIPSLAAWNPERVVSDHYRLLYGIERSEWTRFVFVTRRLDAAAIAPYFATVHELEPLHVAVRSDRELVLKLFLVEGFRGY